jgi:2-polyprenyl-6-methoxyphenol hydroxylase-like FAD-dependent oxidoreductase
MRVGVIGAGPTGLVLGTALARRGHQVTLVDRDPGPLPDGTWPRRGVMQFRHAHVMRTHAVHVVRDEVPDAYDEWLALGAEPVLVEGEVIAIKAQRETYERGVRAVALREPGVTIRQGHVDGVVVEDGRAAGLLVGGVRLDCDLVVEASGRASRATDALGPRASVGGSCGISYVDRVYRLRDGAEAGPMSGPFSLAAAYDGYLAILLPHEHGLFSLILIRRTDDKELARLRHDELWDRACAAIPAIDQWTDPTRSEPVTRALAGGNLLNVYRSQRGPDGRLVLPGLVSVGDAVCTTTPIYARGVALSMLQVSRLLRLVEEHGSDTDTTVEAFADWCDVAMRPWVVEHQAIDNGLARRWAGEDVFADDRLPGDLVLAAAEQNPDIRGHAGPWVTMDAGPESLEPARALARDVYATGWRPSYADGPSRDELVALLD